MSSCNGVNSKIADCLFNKRWVDKGLGNIEQQMQLNGNGLG